MTMDALSIEKPLECEGAETEGSRAYFLEYKSDTERGGDTFVTLQDPTCTILTWNQRNYKTYTGTNATTTSSKGKEYAHTNSAKNAGFKILSRTESSTSSSSFYMVEFF